MTDPTYPAARRRFRNTLAALRAFRDYDGEIQSNAVFDRLLTATSRALSRLANTRAQNLAELGAMFECVRLDIDSGGLTGNGLALLQTALEDACRLLGNGEPTWTPAAAEPEWAVGLTPSERLERMPLATRVVLH
jgi:hypothetical protein